MKVIYSLYALPLLLAIASAATVQFYSQSEKYGIAFAHTPSGNGSDIYMTIEASVLNQWVAVGTGGVMDGSFMVVMKTSGAGDVEISTRRASGHDTPEAISVHIDVIDTVIHAGRMRADVKWSTIDAAQYMGLDMESTKQPWIWAVGPVLNGQDSRRRDNEGADAAGFEQHSSYGVFFADMTKAAQPYSSSFMPQLTGTSNISTRTQGRSYGALVVLHALLLGFAFVVVFPLGTIALRHGWKLAFGAHWITQATASIASLIGLALAIALSIIGVEYSGFDEAHQVLGLCVVALLAVQVLGGYWHHLNFKKLGRRTAVSYGHIWLGRCLIYSGMVDTVLGFLLSQSTGAAIGSAVVSLIFACGMEYVSWRHRRKSIGKPSGATWTSESEIALHNRNG